VTNLLVVLFSKLRERSRVGYRFTPEELELTTFVEGVSGEESGQDMTSGPAAEKIILRA